jgi:uncharacterized membrane protein
LSGRGIACLRTGPLCNDLAAGAFPPRPLESHAIATSTPNEVLPPHVEETARAVEQLHVEHKDRATSLERLLDRLKEQVSTPLFIVVGAIVVTAWIAINMVAGRAAPDPPPFNFLEIVLSFFAFLVTVLILATQRRADTLAAHREQLILQLAFVSEQKTAKIIALLEEQRRDSPQLRDRVDRVAEQMTEAVDPHAVSEALRNTTEGGTTLPDEKRR